MMKVKSSLQAIGIAAFCFLSFHIGRHFGRKTLIILRQRPDVLIALRYLSRGTAGDASSHNFEKGGNHKNEKKKDWKYRKRPEPLTSLKQHKYAEDPYEGWMPYAAPVHLLNTCNWTPCLQNPSEAKCKNYCTKQTTKAPAVPDGWIPDAELVRRMYLKGIDRRGNYFPPRLPDALCEKEGHFDQDYDALKAFGMGEQRLTFPDFDPEPPQTRVMCLLYTMALEHNERIRAIRETWAGQCDGFLAFSTENDPRIPAISLDHEGAEEYDNMWQKSRSIWNFVGEHYVEEYDYFILGGDDLFIFPENLRWYLSTLGSSDDDHFVGRRFKGNGKNNYFNAGGPGYVLSRGTLRKFMTVKDKPDCSPHAATSREDVNMAGCLRRALGIGLTDTRDENGRERFHAFSPGMHHAYTEDRIPKWYAEYNEEWGLKFGADCCAPDSVSFHYIKDVGTIQRLYKLLYGYCPLTEESVLRPYRFPKKERSIT